ncbi:serine-rich adhesin for platelets isoform X3 [Folsomia candida]|nr:serine-rich adhesin for platelets isoform X3 [Folsomia candida]XP_035703292.1 serine-rich adhesin for platelets isoform X3 [Folsomia candida]
MLGSGKNTVKPPDIVLHGPQIAPQHAFIERLGDEVILHPISEHTSVDGRKIHGPTSLEQGNLISIGDSYFFRYDGPPPTSPSYGPHNSNTTVYFEESPYAVINPRSSAHFRPAGGDSGNKNPFPIMMIESPPQSSSASSLTLESESQVCHPDNDRTDQSFTSYPSPRSSSASTTTSDPDQTSSLCTEDSGSRKYRDGLESDQFMNKVARFEFLTHTQPSSSSPPFPLNGGSNGNHGGDQQRSCGNGTTSSHHGNGGYLSSEGLLYSSGSGGYHHQNHYGEKKVLSRPNVNFNRSDQGYGYKDDSSLYSNSSVSPPDRASISNQNNSSKSYRRPGVTFYEDGRLTSPSPATSSFTTTTDTMDHRDDHDEEDSLSSISNHHHLHHHHNNNNHRLPKSQNLNHFHHNGSNGGGDRVPSRSGSTTSSTSSIIPSHHQFNLYNNNHHADHYSRPLNGNSSSEAEIACETLLQIKRKQAEEARTATDMSRKQDELCLDEIVAMCEEYEEQIAKEIQENKRKNSSASASTLSSITSPSPSLSLHSKTADSTNESCDRSGGGVVGGANYNRQMQVHNWKSGQGKEEETAPQPNANLKSPTSPTGGYNYGRIKTNGSLPRDLSRSKSASNVPNRSNVSFADEEISSIFTFNMSDNASNQSSSLNGGFHSFYHGMPDDVFSSPPSMITMNNSSTSKTTSSATNGHVKCHTNPGLSFRNGSSPYENVMMTSGENFNYPPLQVQTPPRLGIRATAGVSLSCRTMTNNGCPATTNNGLVDIQNQQQQRGQSMEPRNIGDNGIMPKSPPPPQQQQHNLSPRVPLNCTTSSSYSSSSPDNHNHNHNGSLPEKVEHIIPISVTPTPPKSKLSVSFANSVKEFGEEDDSSSNRDGESENGGKQGTIIMPSPSGNGAISESYSNANSSNIISNKDYNRSVVKTIATEVQVHVVESQSASGNSNDTNEVDGISANNKSGSIGNVSNGCSSGASHYADAENINQPIQSSPPAICISKCADDVKAPQRTWDSVNIGSQCSSSSASSHSTNVSQSLSQKEVTVAESTELNNAKTTVDEANLTQETSHSFPVDRITVLKKDIRDVEEQEMEAIREMEIEKALLIGEEKSLESQLALDTEELVELKDRLCQIDESSRRWKVDGLERISELKVKLACSEKELQRLERMHEEFCGSTDEETVLLERLKFAHELVESDRKAFEDSEFFQMEEEINRETQRDELSKLVSEKGRRLLARQLAIEKVRSQNKISFGKNTKEIQSLEKKRQELLTELRKTRESSKLSVDALSVPGSAENVSDYDDTSNSDLEEKLRNMLLLSSSTDDLMHIERIKSRSPIDPNMGGAVMGAKTCETLREIERNREYHLNEQGVQMLEEERARVRELQVRVREAVREEWEERKSRNNQCHSLNSVGSEDSGHTASDTPTDSGSGDDTTDKSAAPSISTTDASLTENGQNSFELCQQMRQKQREMSQSFEETRPLSSEASEIGFDENGSMAVNRRDKSRVQIQQNRPLTRYLPVRGDEDEFDLKAHIESSGHQLELCPHITVTRTSARGYLSKLGSRFHNWNKRWFVFDREKRTLVYFSDKNEKKSKSRGGVHFEAIEEVYLDHVQSVKSPNPKLTFCVKTFNRVFYLLAPSAEASRIWIDIIFTGAEGYKEFKCSS